VSIPPIADMPVLITSPEGEVVAGAVTAADGTWSAKVPAGSYLVRSLDPAGRWTDGWHASSGTVADPASATLIDVGASGVAGIDLVAAPVLPSASIRTLLTYAASTALAVAWSGRPGAEGVASYDVHYRRAAWNGSFGGYGTWKSATAATSGTFAATKGYTYCFSARARDTSGLQSAWTPETCTAVPLDDRSLVRSSGWSRRTGAAYYAGTYLMSTRYGASLNRTGVVAKRIAILVTTCKGCGTLSVYWRGKLIKTVSLNSTTTANRKLVTVASFSSAQSGTLVLRVGSSGRRVIVDGVAIRRN
jgi:hypothetical protein